MYAQGIAISTFALYTINNKITCNFPCIIKIFKNILRELITINNIELKKPNRLKEFFHRCYNRIEDILFFIISKLPEKFIPEPLMLFMDKYTSKRIAELKHQLIKNNWRTVALEKVVVDISKVQRSHEKSTLDD